MRNKTKKRERERNEERERFDEITLFGLTELKSKKICKVVD
jgi:hypothetical protein